MSETQGKKKSVPRGLPWLGPFSGIGKALAALFSSRPPCPWEGEGSAPKPQPHNRRGPSGIPWWRNFRATLCHPTPAWDSKSDGVHWPSAQPPCSPPTFPSISLCLFFCVSGPSVGQSPPSRSPSSSSFYIASLDHSAGQEGKEEGEKEDWEEVEFLGPPWKMTPCSYQQQDLSSLSSDSGPCLPFPQSYYPGELQQWLGCENLKVYWIRPRRPIWEWLAFPRPPFFQGKTSLSPPRVIGTKRQFLLSELLL